MSPRRKKGKRDKQTRKKGHECEMGVGRDTLCDFSGADRTKPFMARPLSGKGGKRRKPLRGNTMRKKTSRKTKTKGRGGEGQKKNEVGRGGEL